MTRTHLTPAELYAILDRRFREQRPATCKACAVPLPFYARPPDDVSANWFIGTPKRCPQGCHLVITELMATLWTQYDLDLTPRQ